MGKGDLDIDLWIFNQFISDQEEVYVRRTQNRENLPNTR